ncbi:hypothetical protein VT52_000390 [Streptomyces malaysiense]|uniref:Thiaminase-2/PQQC domain-containing protein n=1 Tax=Streptomyces malaysiense TaxID=1428626 RepID=A0A1J4Q8N2_9ACTN|nr:hypothetical protein VT52_000390 [Streptomyces malaysiense]
MDSVELPLTAAGNSSLLTTLLRPLGLGPGDRCFPAAEAGQLVEAQYRASLEFVYGHPVWRRIRAARGTDGAAPVLAYLLESRHYLAAAPFRMAGGITDALRPGALIRLQAHHVVEEADHDTYFENGLAALGLPRDLVREARPAPVTVEWIHLMRTVAAYGPLAAALCSGLLEYTAGDRESVAGWHTMLVDQGVLSREAVDAIFEHVQTDLGLGHGSNWRHALEAAGVVPAAELADWLNAVSLVAEMIVRWLETCTEGLSATVVEAAPGLALDGPVRTLGGEADGLPVWPAEIYDSVTHGPRSPRPGVRRTLALAYAFSGRATGREPAAEGAGPTPATAARDLTTRTARDWDGGTSAADLEKLVEGWMTAIDGHRLWRRLTEDPTLPLVHGWMVENYHYVAGIWQHAGAAVAACPDPVIRAELVKHLTEEFNHGKMFLRGIERARGNRYPGLPTDRMRPLPTTVAFVGTLRELGGRDWKAYVIALAYLQLSLTAADGGVHARHDGFYRTVFDRCPGAEAMVAAMRRHDDEDTRLGHGDDTRVLLDLLTTRHRVDRESVAAAALVPQLTWSFLDGILQHYRHGEAAIVQRAGWHTDA